MERHLKGLVCGIGGGIAGVALMNRIMRFTSGMVRQRRARPMDVFDTERSMSLVGIHHRRGEPATEALARIAYTRLAGAAPPDATRKRLAIAIHWGFGITIAAAYAATRAGGPRRARRALRDGALFGAALWIVADEIAVPLLGLADRPSKHHPTRHLQALVSHLGYGLASAAATRTLIALLSTSEAN